MFNGSHITTCKVELILKYWSNFGDAITDCSGNKMNIDIEIIDHTSTMIKTNKTNNNVLQ